MTRLPLILAIALAASLTPEAMAQTAPLKGGTLSTYFENDLFAGTDRYYTNGAKISWTSTDLAKFADTPYASPLVPVLNYVPFVNNPAFQKNFVLSIGQSIYTPDDTETTEPIFNDRPYAGWLYAEVGLIWKNDHERNSLILSLGVVGPLSGAEETQRFVHDARGFDHPRGWSNQLHNEFAGMLVYEHTWRYTLRKNNRVGLNADFLPFIGAKAGNVKVEANGGAELRVGLNLPDDFATGTIASGTPTSTPVEGDQATRRAQAFDFGIYVFGRADGRLVAHDIFLDGNSFGNDISVDKRIAVADISVGLALTWKNTSLTYALVHRTKEYDSQRGNGQTFGSVTMSIAF
jgi:hypothetical protein